MSQWSPHNLPQIHYGWLQLMVSPFYFHTLSSFWHTTAPFEFQNCPYSSQSRMAFSYFYFSKQFCDVIYMVNYDSTNHFVWFNNRIFYIDQWISQTNPITIQTIKSKKYLWWTSNLKNETNILKLLSTQNIEHLEPASNTYICQHNKTKLSFIIYYQCIFSQAWATWIKAINNNCFTW